MLEFSQGRFGGANVRKQACIARVCSLPVLVHSSDEEGVAANEPPFAKQLVQSPPQISDGATGTTGAALLAAVNAVSQLETPSQLETKLCPSPRPPLAQMINYSDAQ